MLNIFLLIFNNERFEVFIFLEQSVHYDVLIAGDHIDMNQFKAPAQISDLQLSVESTRLSDSCEHDMSSDDNGSSVMGSVIDQSYTVQETSMSEVEISCMGNVDKNFRSSYQWVDHQTKPLYCIHTFVSKDRIHSFISNSKPQVNVFPEIIHIAQFQ